MRTIVAASVAAAFAAGVGLFIEAGPWSTQAAESAAPAADPAGAPPAVTAPAAAPVSPEEAFLAECSACHMAYPPAMLPARSWQAITGNLADHFGEDASLDPDTTQKIAEFLVANAAETTGQGQWILRGVSAGDVPLRITETRWWRRAHHEVPDSVFARKDVTSRSNCLACHRNGAYEDGEELEND